jgi:SsrA-binding protein
MPNITTNKNALFNYEVLDKFEAGIVLTGQEVKSVKSGQINLKGAYITLSPDLQTQKPALFLIKANIAQYKYSGALPNYDPLRPRKLLVHKNELNSLIGKTKEKGLTLMPISVYTKGTLIKLEFALARGKKLHDKRESIKNKEVDREIRRKLRNKI